MQSEDDLGKAGNRFHLIKNPDEICKLPPSAVKKKDSRLRRRIVTLLPGISPFPDRYLWPANVRRGVRVRVEAG